MTQFNPHQLVELFHLLFLEQLSQKLDKKLYALKGGCNLRFFLKSIRYSEDIDFDIRIIAKNTLRKKINTIINSTPFSQILQTKKIIISNISEPKQTETTQRWKITLKFSNISIELPTKIEFSRRDFNNNVLFQPIDPIIISEYFLRPILVNHYPMEIAFQQKILALMHRTQTQARDVFDLYHLICLGEKGIFHDKNIINNLSIAQENMLTLKFKDFKSQVLAYLPESYKKVYDSEEIWHSMIKAISEKLEKAQQ